jgi:predicted nucleotidyltransferase
VSGNCAPCLSEAARDLFAPHRVSRVALLGDLPESAERDIHLLVEFGPAAPAMTFSTWLRLQRELAARCGCTVELVSVARLEEHVAAEAIALTILYDAASDA